MLKRLRRRLREERQTILIALAAIVLGTALMTLFVNSPGSGGAKQSGPCKGNFC